MRMRNERREMRLWRMALVGIGFGLLTGTATGVLVAAGHSHSAEPTAENAMVTIDDASTQASIAAGFGEKRDPIGILGGVHQRLINLGGAVLIADLDTVSLEASRVEATARAVEIAWEAKPRWLAPGDLVEVASAELLAGELELAQRLEPGTRVVMLIAPEGELLGIAEIVDEGRLEPIDPHPWGALFLGAAGEALAESGFPPVPGSHCDVGLGAASEDLSPLAALLRYFSELGMIAREDRIAALAEVDEEVDRILEDASQVVDSVTGDDVPVAINDVRRQVMAGEDEAELRASYPMLIRLADVDLTTHDVLVFVDAKTGEVTSWIGLTPTGWVDSEGVTHWNSELSIYVEAPAEGNDLLLFLRSTDDVAFDCPPRAGESPLMVVPYDAAFGSSRVEIDLGTLTYSNLPAAGWGA